MKLKPTKKQSFSEKKTALHFQLFFVHYGYSLSYIVQIGRTLWFSFFNIEQSKAQWLWTASSDINSHDGPIYKWKCRAIPVPALHLFHRTVKTGGNGQVWAYFNQILVFFKNPANLKAICFSAILRQPTGQRQSNVRTKHFFLIGPIFFLYYEESLVSSNLNSKLFRFHCVRPKLDTHKLIFILCGENSPNFTCHTTLRVHNINNQSTVPPLRSSLLVCIRKFTWEVKWFEFELKNPIDLIQEVLASSRDILYSLYVHKGPLSSPSIQTYSSVPNRRLSLISVQQRKKVQK